MPHQIICTAVFLSSRSTLYIYKVHQIVVYAQTSDDTDFIRLFQDPTRLESMAVWPFARDEETPLSDVDIIVLLDHSQPIGLRFFSMWNDLERLLDSKVDLVEDGELLPFAAETANRDKQLIYERVS